MLLFLRKLHPHFCIININTLSFSFSSFFLSKVLCPPSAFPHASLGALKKVIFVHLVPHQEEWPLGWLFVLLVVVVVVAKTAATFNASWHSGAWGRVGYQVG